MNAKERLYAVIGGCVGAVLTMVVCSFFPLGAQSQGDSFGDITCTGLTVVNADGAPMVKLSSTFAGGVVEVYDTISYGKDDTSAVKLFGGLLGGGVSVNDRDSKWAVAIGADAYGGVVNVWGEDGLARMSIAEHGAVVSVWGGGANPVALMSAYKHGGNVEVLSKDQKLVATMKVNESGDGVISTWDKNGNPQ